jgi:hypothetical protein
MHPACRKGSSAIEVIKIANVPMMEHMEKLTAGMMFWYQADSTTREKAQKERVTLMNLISVLLLQGRVGNPFMGSTMTVVMLAIIVVLTVSFWKVFEKAGQPGWACLIPIYNLYVLLKIAGRPGWWILLMIIPLVNIVVSLLVAIDVAKAFGQSAAWGVILLFLLCGFGYLLLGFGNYRYAGPGGLAHSSTAAG